MSDLATLQAKHIAALVAAIPGSDQKKQPIVSAFGNQLGAIEYIALAYAQSFKTSLSVQTAVGPDLDALLVPLGIMRDQASFGSGVGVVFGTPNTIIPAGSIFEYAGKKISTTTAYTITQAGSVSVVVQSVEIGVVGNVLAGTYVPAQPIVGVAYLALSSPLSGGAETQNDTSYRLKAQYFFSKTSRFAYGKPGDFVSWAKQADPSLRYCFERNHPIKHGAAQLLIASANASATPTQIYNVAAFIKQQAIVGTMWDVVPLTLVKLNPSVFLATDTPDNRAAVVGLLQTSVSKLAVLGAPILLAQLQIDANSYHVPTTIKGLGNPLVNADSFHILGDVVWTT